MDAPDSSTTSSSTSTSSSTFDGPAHPAPGRSPAAALLDVLRLTHPFPTIVDGLATAAIALVAGGPAPVAARLGLAMIAMQSAIGSLNDIADVEADRGRKPGKPLPREAVSVGTAHAVVVGGAAISVILSLVSGIAAAALGVLILAIGFGYDLRLKGTRWSWLPFAVGIPLLPVYAWLGVGSAVPWWFAILIPAGMLAGAALALANSLVDVERDVAAGVESVASWLGRWLAWSLHAVLFGIVLALAVVTGVDGRGVQGAGFPAAGLILLGAVTVLAGVALTRHLEPASRERGWELEAIGTGVLALGWIASVAG